MTASKNSGYKLKFQQKGRRRYAQGRKQLRRSHQPRNAKVTKRGVTKIVSQMLDKRVEDKFLLDQTYTTLRVGDSDNDATNNCYLKEITPGFSQGTGVSGRVGQKIFWKGMKIMFRMRPIQMENGATTAVTNTANVVPITDPVKVWIIAAPVDVSLSPSDLQVKFRREGLWYQDVQTDNIDDMPDTTYVKKLTPKPILLPRKFRTIQAFPVSVTSGGVTSEFATLFNVPQYCFKNYYLPVKKKILVNNASGYPSKMKYYLYISYDIGAWRTGYDTCNMPEIDFRTCHIYEDA